MFGSYSGKSQIDLVEKSRIGNQVSEEFGSNVAVYQICGLSNNEGKYGVRRVTISRVDYSVVEETSKYLSKRKVNNIKRVKPHNQVIVYPQSSIKEVDMPDSGEIMRAASNMSNEKGYSGYALFG